MESDIQSAPVSTKMLWAGRIVSALPVLMFIVSGILKLLKLEAVKDQFSKLGWDPNLLLGLGILELICAVIYVIPRTSMLGAILLTGYLGGAIATHVRVGEQFIMPAVLGVLIWGGLYLRDYRLRALLPLRT
jgi:uncharacterized membrane protein YphA (DoxX/SURF4 family)